MTGSILGEFFAGKASDILIAWLAKRHNNERKPEYRLYLSTLSAIFMPVGLIIFGATVGKKNFYVPLVGLSVGELCSFDFPFDEARIANTSDSRCLRPPNCLNMPLRLRF